MVDANSKLERNFVTTDCQVNNTSFQPNIDWSHKDPYSFADNIGAKYDQNEELSTNIQSYFNASTYQMAEDVPATSQNEYQALEFPNSPPDSDSSYVQMSFHFNKKATDKSENRPTAPRNSFLSTDDLQSTIHHNEKSTDLVNNPHNLYSSVRKWKQASTDKKSKKNF